MKVDLHTMTIKTPAELESLKLSLYILCRYNVSIDENPPGNSTDNDGRVINIILFTIRFLRDNQTDGRTRCFTR